MAIPNRPSSEIQAQQGQSPVPAFERPMYKAGRRGLDLVSALDDVDPSALSRMSNVFSTYGGQLMVRPGQTALGTTTGTDKVHSLFRLNDPANSAYARFAGSNTALYRGTTGAFTSVDTGYSGDPLTFTPISMPLSNTPYVVVSDRTRQRKFSRTGAVELFGIPPATLTSTALIGQSSKNICLFEASDGSAAASWTRTAGADRATPANAAGAPTITDIFTNTAIQVVTSPGAATGGYNSWIGIARTLNLTFLDAGNTIAASDDDQTHILFNISDPQYLEEIKIYLVCNAAFNPASVPGTGTGNTDAWFKSFRPNDLQQYFEQLQSGLDASDTLRLRTLVEQFKTDQSGDGRSALVNTTGSLDLDRQGIPQIAAGRNIWGEFGILGVPLRRGEWQRIGTDTTRGWDTITGIIITIQTNTNQPITVQLNDWYLYGGSGPDSSDPGSQPYDVRVINYNPKTGAMGNPSAVQATTAWLNPLRQTLTVTPAASGITGMHQRAYVRGGSAAASTDWFFAGENSTDGGAIAVTVTDDARITAETLEIDNDQPVSSVDANGATVLNQILPVYFAVEDYLFGLGDPLQPGRLYRSKKGKPEQWPASEYEDVCSASEELMNGGAYANQGFIFSRTRMYSILMDASGDWTTEPTGCGEGLVGRWAMAVTPYGIAFVSPFGVRLTTGGAPERLSDPFLEPLFRGDQVNGYNPINFAVPTALKLVYYDDELWLTYQDTGGFVYHLIFNFHDKAWRWYNFSTFCSCVYGEPLQGAAATILLGSLGAGAIYTHTGFTDLGTAIPYSFRSGALNFGDPAVEKLVSDIVIDAEIGSGSLTMQPFVNSEASSFVAQTVTGTAGFRRYSFEPFTTQPSRVRNVSVDFSGNAATSLRPYFNIYGVSRMLQPEITFNQATPWEELPGGEGYVWGCIITCDTQGGARTINVEYTTNNGSVTVAASLAVTATGRRKLPFSWTPVLAQQIRLQPTGTCLPWIRYKVEWLSDPEPPRLNGWDTNWENFGTMADKWLKGYLLEADTFNVAKTVVVDIDQTLAVLSNPVTFNGRGVQHIAFARQRGRLFRLRATDTNPGKFYRWQPIFDEEPLQLTRWETEERPHAGMAGRWQKPIEAFISLRSSGTVTLTVTTYGLNGATLDTSAYTIASTGGVKSKVRVPLNPTKGLLFSYLFTATTGFWLYREESEIQVEDFNSGEAKWCPLPASNDDLDPARVMGNASVAAATPGGA